MILILSPFSAIGIRTFKRIFAPLLVALLVLASCGSDETAVGSEGSDKPTVVVTTNILGDVVENLVGDDVDVVVIMDVGTDPHEFQASAKQVAQMGEAGALVTNGASFEEGLLDVIESAEQDGVPVYEAISAVAIIDGEEHDDHGDEHDEEGHDDHDDEHDEHDDDKEHEDEHGDEEDHDDHDDDKEHDDEHGDEEGDEHGDEEGHDDEHDEEGHDDHGHGGVDPHFFTDPARMAEAAEGIADFLALNVEGIDEAALRSNTESYVSQLLDLDSDIEASLEALPVDQRILVTNHDVFAYFAERYDFDIVGTVIPSGTTIDATSAQTMTELTETIETTGVPAIFADTSSSSDVAKTLADEVGGIDVVELFSESLGAEDSDGGTYLDMVRSNATRIVEALTS